MEYNNSHGLPSGMTSTGPPPMGLGPGPASGLMTTNGGAYRCGSNTSSSSGRGSISTQQDLHNNPARGTILSQQLSSLPRGFSQTQGRTLGPIVSISPPGSGMTGVPHMDASTSSQHHPINPVSANIPMQRQAPAGGRPYYSTLTARPSSEIGNAATTSQPQRQYDPYFHNRPPLQYHSHYRGPPPPPAGSIPSGLPRNGGPPVPAGGGKRSSNGTEYAILKFNSNSTVGKEIDV